MSATSNTVNNGSRMSALVGWIDARFPMTRMWKEHVSEYYAPKNFNFWYYFGSLALVVLVLQIVTGIFLTMNYKPSAAEAFASVEYIMRDVEWGWLIRYMHSTGASAFFIVVYLHMFRGIMYGSYKTPRELVWIFGMLIYLALMAEAFFGYLLPWGNMSYWGAQVIVSLFGAIPGIGESLVEWIRGDYYISDITLNRFFALHVVALPIALIFLVIAHILALHEVGSNNPDGVEIKKLKGPDGHPVDGIPFHPYYTVKDGFAIVAFFILFAWFVFFAPDALGHADNYTPANPLQTPAHIVPEWYFLPFYAMLRAVPEKLMGVLTMFGAIALLFAVPWLDTSKVRSMRYRPTARWFFLFFVLAVVLLGWCGGQLPDDVVIPVGHNEAGHPVGFTVVWLSRILAVYYYAYFLIVLPLLGLMEKPLPVPDSISTPVLSGGGAAVPAGAAASPEKKG